MTPILNTMVVGDPASSVEYPLSTFFLGYRGSIAHNMFVPKNDPNSIDDIDLMGFVFGESRHYFGLHEWGSRGTKEIKQGQYDVVLYEARKAVSLLLQGNPNIMSMLWLSEKYRIVQTEASRQLLASRSLFVGKHVYNAFAGYAYQQLTKMETRDPADLRQYLALTAEAKARGIHPNHKGEVVYFPKDYDLNTGEARNARAHGDESLLQQLRHYIKKGENLGYMGDKRKHLVLQNGYDCYEDATTEFLTSRGWKKFDDVTDEEDLFVVDPKTGGICHSAVLSRTDKFYSGKMYTVDAYGTKATITPNHNLLSSPARRSAANNFSNEYKEEKSDWSLTPIQDLLDGRRSHFHVRRAAELTPGDASEDMRPWLSLMGLYLSDGTINFEKNGSISSLHLSQQPHNEDFCEAADRLIEWSQLMFNGGSKHVYEKEVVYCFPVVPSRQILEWCGHSREKHLPTFCFGMNGADASILWGHLMLGDGTEKDANDCYYSSSERLASDIHAMMASAGYYCTMYGPYDYDGKAIFDGVEYDRCPMYHVVAPSNEKRVHCLNTGKILRAGNIPKNSKSGFPIKESIVNNCRIVCLESQYGTLITRNSGKVAIQGNSKNASHLIRLLRMCIEFMRTGEMIVERPDAAELLDIKMGRWKLEDVRKLSDELFAEAKAARDESKLPAEPEYDKAEALLVSLVRDSLTV